MDALPQIINDFVLFMLVLLLFLAFFRLHGCINS